MTAPADFTVRCDVPTIQLSSSGSITGTIFAVIGGKPFPDQGWSDFVVVVIAWWLQALNSLATHQTSVALAFMDGPFEMRVTRTSPTTYNLDCVERTLESELISHTASVELLQMIHEAENAAGTVLAVCDANQWKSRDIETLRTLLSRSTARMRH